MSKSIYDEHYRALVDALKAARLDAGVTQQEVASALDKPQSFVAKYEGHERRLDMVEYLRIAGIIGWDPAPRLGSAYNEILAES